MGLVQGGDLQGAKDDPPGGYNFQENALNGVKTWTAMMGMHLFF